MMIIDTDVLIDAGRGFHEAVECLEKISVLYQMAISSVTSMELIVGCRNKTELQNLDRFLCQFRMIRIDEQISEMAVNLLKTYRLSHGLFNPGCPDCSYCISDRYPIYNKKSKRLPIY